jgi:proline iminopeptidase
MIPTPPPEASGTTRTTLVPLWWGAWGAAEAPPVVLLHGGPGAHHDYLLPQLLHLADAHRVITYDQRGGGRSRTDDPAPIGWQTHVADLTAVLAELPTGRAPVLVGYSWGALLAMAYTIEAVRGAAGPVPRALALLSPAAVTAGFKRESEAAFAARAASPAVQALRDAHAADPRRTSNPAAWRQRAFEVAVAPWFHDPSLAHDLTPFRLVERVQRSTWESLGEYDLRPGLAEVRAAGTVKALVVSGRDDPIPLASAKAAADALGAPCVALDACGHVPYVEAPVALFAALDPFLRTVTGPGPA